MLQDSSRRASSVGPWGRRQWRSHQIIVILVPVLIIVLLLILALVLVLVLVLVSDGCATAAGPRDLRLKHDGRSLPAPFLPVKVGYADCPLDKGALFGRAGLPAALFWARLSIVIYIVDWKSRI